MEIRINEEERSALVSLLNLELRDKRLVYDYAKTLNSIFNKLTNSNHSCFTRNFSEEIADDEFMKLTAGKGL